MASDKEGSALPASGLALVLALLVGAVAVRDLSLEQYRPGRSDKSTERLLELQDAQARLWQDPFHAVQQHQDELQKALKEQRRPDKVIDDHRKRHGFAFLQQKLALARTTDDVLVLGVTVPGGPYADEAERRQRSRYAVLAGLNTLGFAPDDGEHVGYVAVGCEAPPDKCDTRLLPDFVPFEWLTRLPNHPSNAPEKKVVVLWLTEQPMAAKPIASIKTLAARLGVSADTPRVRIRMLSPFSSDALQKLSIEAAAEPAATGRQIEIYSPSATASAEALKQSESDPSIPFCREKSGAKRVSVCVLRTIATDEKLAELLLKELGLRGIHPERDCGGFLQFGCDRVALISEWDTLYGRNLPDAVANVICGDKKSRAPPRDHAEAGGCAAVLRASYLQGIDGAIAADAPAAAAGTAPRRDQKDQTKESARTERADGRHQFDYLRRLADKLRQENASLERGQITAIGILGSDVYDKLLVLRALRNEFPKAQFFTTDLDARLLHPMEFKTARNVVIASGFGLELQRNLQQDIPPFRDVYQTSVFYATRLAGSGEGDRLDQVELDSRISPRVFEIGRHSAFGLSGPSAAECKNDPALCAVQPPRRDFVPRWLKYGLLLYLPAVLLAMLVAFPLYPRFLRRRASPPLDPVEPNEDQRSFGVARWVNLDAAMHASHERRTVALMRFLAACAALLLLMHGAAVFWLDGPSNAEPVTFYEGISVWPTEALRLMGGALALFFVYWSIIRMQRSQIELSQWFFKAFDGKRVPEYTLDRSGCRGIVANMHRSARERIFACDLLQSQTGGGETKRIQTERFWHECAFQSSVPASLIRTGVGTLIFAAFSFLLVVLLGIPHTPFRGPLSHYVDLFAVVAWSTPALIFLTFYVLDATLQCTRFISALGEAHTDWPAHTREHFGAGSALPADPEKPELTAAQRDLEEATDHWIDIRLSAKRTAAVSGLVYYPLMVMLILLFARSTLFDNWHWPAGLVIPLALSIVMMIACIVVLRRAAERARDNAISSISSRVLAAKGRSDGAANAALLELMLKNIVEVREGAFASITHQPIIKALLIFFSASGIAMLEYFGIIAF
jgi:hypothetical protein